METCDECGSMMSSMGDEWICRSCGFNYSDDPGASEDTIETVRNEKSERRSTQNELAKVRKKLKLVTNTVIPLSCPDCSEEGVSLEIQDNSSPEFVCEKCDYRWKPDK
ncbi:hypothetical protein EXE48_14615 [Halorubrum sp. ASP1]|uniref:hypothetical protein n=1 Tax=Halorubrum sp. ASP1 TaxID=2518114 RepID=UPI0010F7443A|nr:hypothetical protein [Halorubrum sp. ASP1]TKX59733.1 hypothetical protein EXE48_14615 [Halorubrum sp. ASP1]